MWHRERGGKEKIEKYRYIYNFYCNNFNRNRKLERIGKIKCKRRYRRSLMKGDIREVTREATRERVRNRKRVRYKE